MKKPTRSLRNLLPHRRRRFWRYISPRRHGVGVALLALLLATAGGYWHLTNGRRIREQAEAYLGRLTGGDVRISQADFSLFGGVKLENVRLRIPGQGGKPPFFRARNVVLRHRPWSLFATGQLHPTEIACGAPEVIAEYDVDADTWNFMELVALARESRADPLGGRKLLLPRIRAHGMLRVVEVEGSMRSDRQPVPLTVLMTPTGESSYVITVLVSSARFTA